MKKTVKVLRLPRTTRVATKDKQDYPFWVALPVTDAEITINTFLFGRRAYMKDFTIKGIEDRKPFLKVVEIPEEELEPHMTVVG